MKYLLSIWQGQFSNFSAKSQRELPHDGTKRNCRALLQAPWLLLEK